MILIVDDKSENLFSLKTLLQINRFEVDTASSGEEALRKVLKNDYELIILDVQMPDMDGYEVAEAIKGSSRSRNIPILFLSAVNIDKRFISKGYEAGGIDYIVKPFDPDLLILKVKTFQKLYLQTEELNRIKETLEQKVEERTKALSDINAALEASNAELQQYAYIASHDLQEPLRKILTFGRIVSEKFLVQGNEAESYMVRIINAAERMRRLIDDLLNFSRLSGGALFTTINLSEVLSGTLSDLELAIKEKNAEIRSDSLPAIEGVPGQMRQVFQNIISNALKFSKPGIASRIVIKADRTASLSFDAPSEENGKFLRISFADNGIGFDEKYLEKIFTLFQRLHGKEEYDGTGIGLSIVKKIVEKHNGIITAKSVVGKGTTFYIVLPLKQTVKPVATADISKY